MHRDPAEISLDGANAGAKNVCAEALGCLHPLPRIPMDWIGNTSRQRPKILGAVRLKVNPPKISAREFIGALSPEPGVCRKAVRSEARTSAQSLRPKHLNNGHVRNVEIALLASIAGITIAPNNRRRSGYSMTAPPEPEMEASDGNSIIEIVGPWGLILLLKMKRQEERKRLRRKRVQAGKQRTRRIDLSVGGRKMDAPTEKEFRDAGYTMNAINFPLSAGGFVALCQYNNIPHEKAPRAWRYAPNEAVRQYWDMKAGEASVCHEIVDQAVALCASRRK